MGIGAIIAQVKFT